MNLGKHIKVKSIQSAHKNVRKLKGRKFNGTVYIQGVPFHLQGIVEKYYVLTQRCIVKTRANRRLNIPADAVRAML